MNNSKSYPKYKDSEVEWIGEIPEHWAVEKGKWLFSRAQRAISKDDEIVTCFRDGEVTLRTNRKTDGFTNALKEHGYQGIRKGDLVIHAMDAFAGAVGVSDSDGKSTPVYSACIERTANTVNSYYYAYFMRDLATSGFIESLAKGIRERSSDFRFNDFAELQITYPPLPEQTAIAEFLDDKVGKVDQAIAQKELLIKQLNERKQIVIQNAVTKGLNPDAPMKDSELPWAPEVPAHWSLQPNKSLFNLKKSIIGQHHSDYKLLSLTKKGVIVRDLSTGKGKFSDFIERNQEVLPNDLVFCLFDVEETPRTVGLSLYKGMISPDYTVFECLTPGTSKFLEYFYIAMDDEKRLSCLYRGLRKRIPKPWFLATKTPMPPDQERAEIVNHIVNTSELTKEAVTQAEQAITKLKEYKATLINSAVTGKIKVKS